MISSINILMNTPTQKIERADLSPIYKRKERIYISLYDFDNIYLLPAHVSVLRLSRLNDFNIQMIIGSFFMFNSIEYIYLRIKQQINNEEILRRDVIDINFKFMSNILNN